MRQGHEFSQLILSYDLWIWNKISALFDISLKIILCYVLFRKVYTNNQKIQTIVW